MCGIIAIIGCHKQLDNNLLDKLKLLIDNRGPDYRSPEKETILKCKLKISFKASVLHLRGNSMQQQPYVDNDDNILLFNGEIYKFGDVKLSNDISDTLFLSEKLKRANSKEEIIETIASIDGPYAFIYSSNKLQTLFYGRDLFGRKSLCVMIQNDCSFPQIISSVTLNFDNNNSWSEVDCSGIHSIEYSGSNNELSNCRSIVYLWPIDKIYPKTKKCDTINRKDNTVYKSIEKVPLQSLNNVELRLFEEFTNNEFKLALDELGERLISAVSRRLESTRLDCLNCRRLYNNHQTYKECKHSKILVAFSGGIDSTMLAFILNKLLPDDETIDLSTVAFKEGSPDRESVGKAFKELQNLCPRRNWRLILCDITKDILQQERNNIIADLILPCNTVIDDSLGCGCYFISQAKGRTLDSKTNLNDSEFDKFLSYNPTNTQNISSNVINYDYKSPASLIFAGMGIDEQLGGYSSHKASWMNGSSYELNQEISFQMRRLSSRNLGRDDRCFSNHGRDVRLPYLDFDLISFLNQLPVGLKMNLNETNDVGPKKILRELAKEWGLNESGKRVKRALQFGTRIANLEETKEKGNEPCSRLINKV